MISKHHALGLALFYGLGCGQEGDARDDGTATAGTTADDGRSGAPGDTPPGERVNGRVSCTLYYRQSNEVLPGQSPDDPAFQFQERAVELSPGEDDGATLGELTLGVSYSDDPFEGGSIGVRIDAGDTRLFSSLYQLRDRRLPDNQFVGDHGFSGLIYLTHPTEGGDYQLICKSVP